MSDTPTINCDLCGHPVPRVEMTRGCCQRCWEIYGAVAPATGIEADVCEDIAARQRLGLAKYGTTVAGNPLPLREWLQHAYEECLDQAIYLRRAIAEIDSNQ